MWVRFRVVFEWVYDGLGWGFEFGVVSGAGLGKGDIPSDQVHVEGPSVLTPSNTGHLTLPFFEDELLVNGQVYYLLPLGVSSSKGLSETVPSSVSTSFRKDQNSAFEVLPSNGNGVWRVKMVIDSKELEEMMSGNNAEALIQMMRSAVKSSRRNRRQGV
uniref:Uncharacterized protein n=1 Tax=Chenopodium quinoa TaxID=63459 RepID=A0A803M2Q4_CHEQI